MTELYQEAILDLYKNPLHFGKMDEPDVVLDQTNSSCGDRVKIYLKIEDNKIVDIKWEGIGCVISQAGVSVLTDYILENNLTVEEVKKIDQEKMVELLGLEVINPGRQKCLMMGVRAFENE